jgi:hypothetical protein
MSFAFTYGRQFGPEQLESGTVKVAILMTDTNVEDKINAEHVSDISLDEMDGSNYTRKTISVTAAPNTGDQSYNVDAADVVWASLGVGTRFMAGLLVFYFDTDDAASTPLFWINGGGFPIDADGTDFTWVIASLGFGRWLNGL